MSLKTEARKAEIIKITRERSVASVDLLSDLLGVSAQTIRRDINQLCEQNILRRRHGGAEIYDDPLNAPYDLRETLNLDAKKRISQAAAAMVPNGSIIFISIGTTLAMVAVALQTKKNLTVVTNNLNAAMALSGESTNRIILPGGEVRLPDRDILGEVTPDLFGRYRADFGFYGVAGIDGDGGLLDFHRSEVEVRECIRQSSRSAVLVADHTKFGRAAPAIGGNIAECDMVVTDQRPNAAFADLQDALGDRLIIAGETGR